MLLFADDAAVFAYSPESLQNILKQSQDYCIIWGLKLNTNKTKIMIFQRGRHTSHDIYINDQEIEIVKSFKYLGVNLFKNNNWNRTQQRVAQHASHALHNLFIILNQTDLPISELIKLYNTMVVPTLNYGAEIFDFHECKDIELIHNKFCRKIVCV